MSPNPPLYRCTFPTPLGQMSALCTDEALCALEFEKPTRQALLDARLRRFFGSPRLLLEPAPEPAARILARTRAWLEAYFRGRFEPEPVPLDLRGTEFEQRVWALLRALPVGTQVTYGQLAARLGLPAGARAVGGASRRNPIGILVPCHRVVGHNGALTGYGGGLPSKEWLLRHESRAGAQELLPALGA